MFSQPNKEEALRNLGMMAKKLHIKMEDVPAFLEDYGDTFLSPAYFKEALDTIVPVITNFTESPNEQKQITSCTKTIELGRRTIMSKRASTTSQPPSPDG